MISQQKRDAVSSELSALEALLASVDDDDFVARRSLSYRRDELAAEIADLVEQQQNLGHVVLSFEGGPVLGSRGIDTTFASRTLSEYQELITKQVAAENVGTLAQRGPVPAQISSRLNITNVVHGSFGFELQEVEQDQFPIFESPVKQAITAVDDVLASFSGSSEETYRNALELVDRRVFISVQRFFESLYKDSASLKIVEAERDLTLDQYAVLRARSRIRDVEVIDEQIVLVGELLGLTPVSRTYDFSAIDGRIVSGKVGQRLSDDYLERLHGEERISGRKYAGVFSRRRATSADGSINESFMLLDLREPSEADQIGLISLV